MIISAMVAQASNGVIGKDNDIPWRGKLKGEQLLFKKYTEGKAVVMGRKTWESIPNKFKPLPGRVNLVVSNRFPRPEGPIPVYCKSIEGAIIFAQEVYLPSDEIVLIGGQRIYEEGLPYCNRLYLTLIDKEFKGDTYFPELVRDDWETIHEEFYPPNNKRPLSYTFKIMERRND